MTERFIRENDIQLATEAFGEPTNPPVLLIMGAMASMLWWPDKFCERLAHRARYVIRYDQRDTGLSTKYPPGRPTYTSDDTIDDVIRVLDFYAIAAAHIVGVSGGGAVGQYVALKYPSRVLSLTAISTTPIATDTSHLPGSTEAYNRHAAAGTKVDWSDRDQAVAYMIEEVRAIAGIGRSVDEPELRRFVERDFDRSGGYESATNYFILENGDMWDGELREMQAPLLVIHGTADPLFPVEHGIALSEAVAGAKFIAIEGSGHGLHEDDFGTIIDAIVKHTAA